MSKLIFNALSAIFDGSMATKVFAFIESVMMALTAVFTSGEVMRGFTVLQAVAGSLLIIFFFVELTDNASKDMITLERLVLAFIKLILGMCLLMFLKEIIAGLFAFVYGIYHKIANAGVDDVSFGITFWGQSTFPESFDVLSEADQNFEGLDKNPLKAIMGSIGLLVNSLVLWRASWIALGVSYFVAISNAISLIARATFSPIAVAQCFNDGQKSNAIRYLKKFAADGLTMAVIVGILYAASTLQGHLVSTIMAGESITSIDSSTAIKVMENLKVMLSIFAINFGAIGAILKAPSLAQDIVGAH